MPYIVTTHELDETSGMPTPPMNRPYAVATLEDARDYVIDELGHIYDGFELPVSDEHNQRAAELTESGGTIGPLPDGYVIEVQRVDWLDLERDRRGQPTYPGSVWPINVANDPRDRKGHGFSPERVANARQTIIDAYNRERG